jgi:AP-1 complex subunit mu
MAGAISAIYILDSKGKQLISRDFRGDTPAGCVERFVGLVTGALQVLFCKVTFAK